MRASLLALALVVACHKDESSNDEPGRGNPPSTAAADALWKLAPAGTIGGVVISPRGLAMTEHAYQDITSYIKQAPELGSIATQMTSALTTAIGSPQLSFAALGLTTQTGGAMFFTEKDRIAILPLGDRDKFLAIAHGTKGEHEDKLPDFMGSTDGVCRSTHGVYACGTPALLAKLGTGGELVKGLAQVGARGDIEVIVHDVPNSPPGLAVAAVVQLERGMVTVRGSVAGAPKQILGVLAPHGTPRTDDGHATGFAIAHVKSWLAGIPMTNKPIMPGVTESDLVAAITDPITVTTNAAGIDARVPLTDTAPIQKALDQCTTLLAPLGAKIVDGACHFPIPNYGLDADVWLDGKELRFGTKQSKPATTGELTPLGKELAGKAWMLALWGHGTIFDVGKAVAVQAAQAPIPDLATTLVRVMTPISEVGLGVRVDGDAVRFVIGFRTIWSNPDEVVGKVMAIDPGEILAGRGGALAKPIADAAPRSPFAADFKAGYSGMMMPTAVIGVLAAVAIPAFLDYMKRSKKTEASLQLSRIGKYLKRYYADYASFPAGDAGPTPATGCCMKSSTGGKVDNKCPADATIWKQPIWTALEFQIDEASNFQYRYHSDGKTARVEAISDLDCDGVPATWTPRRHDQRRGAGPRSPPAARRRVLIRRRAAGPSRRDVLPARTRRSAQPPHMTALETIERELRDVILESPDDLAARMVYADWLLERGDPRGELIALECAQATEDERGELRRRALWQHHRETWLADDLGSSGIDPRRVEYRCGFIHSVQIAAARLVEVGPILARHPIHTLRIGARASELAEVADRPVLRTVRRLELITSFDDESAIARLFASPELVRLEGVSLALRAQSNGTAGDWAALDHCAQLGALTHLALSSIEVSVVRARWLGRELPALRELDCGHSLSAPALRALAESATFRLRRFRIDNRYGPVIGDATIAEGRSARRCWPSWTRCHSSAARSVPLPPLDCRPCPAPRRSPSSISAGKESPMSCSRSAIVGFQRCVR